jgi:GNAT superfamily N-acetyltransferase
MDSLRVIDLNDPTGKLVERDWFARALPVHRELRPKLPDAYLEKMEKVFRGGGRMCVAASGETVLGVAVYRIHENTAEGLQMYVDDLITTERSRSSGVGRALLGHLQRIARQSGCENFTLDSGTWRQQAHKFYFREGLVIQSFHFSKPILTGS